MSVYHKEKPEYLRQSLDSIFSQTLPPTEVVLVEDGPLADDMEKVINDFQSIHPELKLVKLDENQGLGIALSEGLKNCSYELVARMDTDDICKPERFERQIRLMEQRPDIDVCGCWIDEFVDDTAHVVSTRKLPERHEDICQFGKKRNPINHPTVVFRKEVVEKVGGYQHFYLFEDYYLWVRLILAGATFYNIQESLLYFRMSHEMFNRRGGFNYSRSEIKFQRTIHKLGYISGFTMCKNISMRLLMRHLPNVCRKYIYLFLLRK